MSVYLERQTISNAFCELIDGRKTYYKNGIEDFQNIKFDKIMNLVENNTDKFNAAELIYASDTIKATFLINQESDITRKMLGQIARKSENKLSNSILLSFTNEIHLTLAELCKRNPNDPRCTTNDIIKHLNYIETSSILRDNNYSAFINDEKIDSIRGFARVNARIVMSDDRDLEAKNEKIEMIWNSYKEYIIKFWEELEQNNL